MAGVICIKGLCTIPEEVRASVLVKTVFRVLFSKVGHSWSARQGCIGNSGVGGGTLGFRFGNGHAIACPNLSTIFRLVRTGHGSVRQFEIGDAVEGRGVLTKLAMLDWFEGLEFNSFEVN